ncbi:hypothetical protein Drorol1_Dr00013239 [Drosera rotundifolia]
MSGNRLPPAGRGKGHHTEELFNSHGSGTRELLHGLGRGPMFHHMPGSERWRAAHTLQQAGEWLHEPARRGEKLHGPGSSPFVQTRPGKELPFDWARHKPHFPAAGRERSPSLGSGTSPTQLLQAEMQHNRPGKNTRQASTDLRGESYRPGNVSPSNESRKSGLWQAVSHGAYFKVVEGAGLDTNGDGVGGSKRRSFSNLRGETNAMPLKALAKNTGKEYVQWGLAKRFYLSKTGIGYEGVVREGEHDRRNRPPPVLGIIVVSFHRIINSMSLRSSSAASSSSSCYLSIG